MWLDRFTNIDVHFRVHNGLHKSLWFGVVLTRESCCSDQGGAGGLSGARAGETQISTVLTTVYLAVLKCMSQGLLRRTESVSSSTGIILRTVTSAVGLRGILLIKITSVPMRRQQLVNHNDAKATTACQANFSHS